MTYLRKVYAILSDCFGDGPGRKSCRFDGCGDSQGRRYLIIAVTPGADKCLANQTLVQNTDKYVHIQTNILGTDKYTRNRQI